MTSLLEQSLAVACTGALTGTVLVSGLVTVTGTGTGLGTVTVPDQRTVTVQDKGHGA